MSALKPLCAAVMTVALLVVALFTVLSAKLYKPEAGVAILAGTIAFGSALIARCLLELAARGETRP